MTNVILSRRQIMSAAAIAPVLGSAHAASGESEFANYKIPNTAVLPITSRINGERYSLYVRWPSSYKNSSGKYPVVLTLDADYQFPIAAMHMEHLADRNRQGPEAILVSIAYPGQYPDRNRYQITRTRDYTPIFWPDGGYGKHAQAQSGGGPKFRDVIEREVLPEVAKHWRADLGDTTFVGHSYGGLFGAWTLVTRPELFARYLLISPSLWYADDFILKLAKSPGPAALQSLKRVYLAAGALEETASPGRPMVSNMNAFADSLMARNDPNLQIRRRTFDDETHASILPAAFSSGLRELHGDWVANHQNAD